MLTLRRLPSVLLPLLGAAALLPSTSMAAVPTGEQCGSTFTATVSGAAPTLSIGGQSVTTTPGADSGTVTFPAPSPAFAAGPAYPVVQPGGYDVGVYRDGCFAVLPGADTSPGINEWLDVPGGRGPAAGGNRVTLLVFGIPGKTPNLFFGGVPGTAPQVSANNGFCIPEAPTCTIAQRGWIVSAIAPAAQPGTRFVDVTVHDGDTVVGGQTAASDDYEYQQAPKIVAVTPSHGALTGTNRIALSLTGAFYSYPAVTIGGQPATEASTDSSGNVYDGSFGNETITVTVPATTTPGPADVTVAPSFVVPSSPVPTALPGGYTYDAPAPPVVLPTISAVIGSGNARLGGLIAVTGANFSVLRGLRIGTTNAVVLTKTSSVIYAYVPPLAAGSYPVTVVTSRGRATAQAQYTFR